MNLLDHLITIVLIVGLPLYAVRSLPGTKARIASGVPGARVRMYWETCRMQWVLTALLLGGWWYAGRTGTQLGFSVQLTGGFWIVFAILVGLCAAMAVQYVRTARSEKGRHGSSIRGDTTAYSFLSRFPLLRDPRGRSSPTFTSIRTW